MALEDPPSPPKSQKTNTIIITSLSPPFFHPQIQKALRSHFEIFGEIHTWAPIRGLGRIIVVYFEDDCVEQAKSLDGMEVRDDSQWVDTPW